MTAGSTFSRRFKRSTARLASVISGIPKRRRRSYLGLGAGFRVVRGRGTSRRDELLKTMRLESTTRDASADRSRRFRQRGKVAKIRHEMADAERFGQDGPRRSLGLPRKRASSSQLFLHAGRVFLVIFAEKRANRRRLSQSRTKACESIRTLRKWRWPRYPTSWSLCYFWPTPATRSCSSPRLSRCAAARKNWLSGLRRFKDNCKVLSSPRAFICPSRPGLDYGHFLDRYPPHAVLSTP